MLHLQLFFVGNRVQRYGRVFQHLLRVCNLHCFLWQTLILCAPRFPLPVLGVSPGCHGVHLRFGILRPDHVPLELPLTIVDHLQRLLLQVKGLERDVGLPYVGGAVDLVALDLQLVPEELLELAVVEVLGHVLHLDLEDLRGEVAGFGVIVLALLFDNSLKLSFNSIINIIIRLYNIFNCLSVM